MNTHGSTHTGTRRPAGRGSARAAALSLAAGLSLVGLTTGTAAQAAPNPSCLGFDSAAASTTTGVLYCQVPTGVTALSAVVTGAGGGGGSGVNSSTGGDGAVVTTTLAVTPGELLTLEVGTGGGARGDANAQGGGGGGWSAVKRSGTALVIAGGGGGGGSVASGSAAPAGLTLAGGDAGTPGAVDGAPASMFYGGDGADSGTGATASAGGLGGSGGQGGGNGSAGAGGRGGEPCSTGGSQGGSGWQGGQAAGTCYGTFASTGGGGGAGAYGGGGGGASYGGLVAGGSGGGGSSFDATGQAVFSLATNGGAFRVAGGDGRVVLAAPAPTITSVSPGGGSSDGGTTVTVTGTNFAGGTTVTIGGQPCASVTVTSSTSLTCSTPAGAVGAVDVTVTSTGQSATLNGGYTYAHAAPGSPRTVTATAGRASLTVTWAAPATGGPVTRYEVYTTQGDAVCSTTSLSCLLGAEAGQSYDVYVVAVGPGGDSAPGHASSDPVDEPSVPSTVPTDAPLTLTTDKGQITEVESGEQLTVIGTGFAPHSTATVVIYSTPTVLGSVLTDAAGDFAEPVTVPSTLAAGEHTLVAAGVAPDGTDRFLRMAVTIAASGDPAGDTSGDTSGETSGDPAADPGTTSTADPTGTASSAATGDDTGEDRAELAYTGIDVALPVTLGVAAILTGAALLVLARRRRRA